MLKFPFIFVKRDRLSNSAKKNLGFIASSWVSISAHVFGNILQAILN